MNTLPQARLFRLTSVSEIIFVIVVITSVDTTLKKNAAYFVIKLGFKTKPGVHLTLLLSPEIHKKTI